MLNRVTIDRDTYGEYRVFVNSWSVGTTFKRWWRAKLVADTIVQAKLADDGDGWEVVDKTDGIQATEVTA